jgi:hypothetical protein
MTDLQLLIFLIVALFAAVAYWAHIGKNKIPVWAANLVLFTLYSSWCKYLMIEGPGDGGKSFAALMFWFLLLIVHILIALIVIVALRINKKTE